MLGEGVLVRVVIWLWGLAAWLGMVRSRVGWVTKVLLDTFQTHVDKLVLRADLLCGL
jgi:hypothetical protein